MDESEAPAAPSALAANPTAATTDPATALSALAAQLASLYNVREPLKLSLAAIETEISRVEILTHQAMTQAGITAFSTREGDLSIKPRIVYNATDWQALYDHIQTTGEFDLLTRTLKASSLRERGAALPPGVMQAAFDTFAFKPIKRTP